MMEIGKNTKKKIKKWMQIKYGFEMYNALVVLG